MMLTVLWRKYPHSMPTTIEGSGVIIDCITGVTVVRLHMELAKEGAR